MKYYITNKFKDKGVLAFKREEDQTSSFGYMSKSALGFVLYKIRDESLNARLCSLEGSVILDKAFCFSNKNEK